MAKSKSLTSGSEYDCAVIGGGPGGLVSALYLSRFKRRVLLVDAGHSRAQWIPKIRNLIGHTKGLSGLKLLKKLKQQVLQYKTNWVQGEAQVFRFKKGFRIDVNGDQYTARAVVLATGMKDKQPPVDNLPELRRRNVLAYCPICDGYEHMDRRIGILVNSASGLKKAAFLSRYSKNIFLFQVQRFTVRPRQRQWLSENGFRLFEGELESLNLKVRPKRGLAVKMKGKSEVLVDVAYVALGVDFNPKTTEHLKGLRKNKEGFILTTSHQETSIPNLYAVGDCVSSLAQVSVAVGQAALAATRIHNSLNSK